MRDAGVAGHRNSQYRAAIQRKRLLVDATSATSLSGRYVLLGHLRQLLRGLSNCDVTVLVNADARELTAELPEAVSPPHCGPRTGRWLDRVRWFVAHGERFCRHYGVDTVFSPSGMLALRCPGPQVVLAQNPWPFVGAPRMIRARAKMGLQRLAFARAQRMAHTMVYNSCYMRTLYEEAFGESSRSCVAYQGIDESLFQDARRQRDAQRETLVLCVSVMARHKAIETLVDAHAHLVDRVPATRLALVGPWPDEAYLAEVLARIARLGLEKRVLITGLVAPVELRAWYARARVFCLLSRCESFGIPAVEAQAYGTPVIAADGTAAPEIVGAGGLIVKQGDAVAAAGQLHRLLTDAALWSELSASALLNAERFQWSECSLPLVDAIDRALSGAET